MVQKRLKKGEKIKKWFDNHPFWVVLSIVLFVLTLAIAAGTVFSFTKSYVENNILWKSAEQQKIDNLAPTQTLGYFNSVLGEPNTKTVRGDITRYIYRERGYWIEAFSDKNDIIQMFDITACGEENFYPKIKNNPVGDEIVLGKTPMLETTGMVPLVWKTDQQVLKIHYYLRGATAPSYYYDEYYVGNPSNYQTVFTGHNELCGYLVLPKDISDSMTAYPVGKNPLNEEQVDRLRRNTIINTFAVTSPSFDLKVDGLKNVADGGLGVSYVDEGVLLPTRKVISKKDDVYQNARDFEVVTFN